MFRRLTPVAKKLLIINAAIFFLSSAFRLPLSEWFGLRVVFSEDFAPYQFITYMWLHASMWHLIGNMIAVLFFAPILESVWGPKRFLTFYLVCGIGAGLLYGAVDFAEKLPLKQDKEAYFENPTPEAFERFVLKHKSPAFNTDVLVETIDDFYAKPESIGSIGITKRYVQEIYDFYVSGPLGKMIGASGAVFGILFAFAFLFPNTEIFLLFPPIPVKAKYLVFFYALYELYSEINRIPGDNVAHLAHLGGMAIAFVLLKVWQRKSGSFY